MGVTAAFIFAAQMLNFPIAGGTSGHFLGAVFSSVLLGPWASLIIMTIVLIVQCLGFADGGLTAIGSNIFNMGIVGSLGGYSIFFILYTLFQKSRKGFFIALAISSWLSIVMGASAAAIELAISGTSPLKVALPASDWEFPFSWPSSFHPMPLLLPMVLRKWQRQKDFQKREKAGNSGNTHLFQIMPSLGLKMKKFQPPFQVSLEH
jgi:ABC-type Co2+ transport system permease subunit